MTDALNFERSSAFLAPFERAKYQDEEACLKNLLSQIGLDGSARKSVVERAAEFVKIARSHRDQRSMLDNFLQEFGLSNQEGIALMCLAEALLRVPDSETADKLIAEKIKSANWSDHTGKSDSLLVNASTWGLMLTGRVIDLAPEATSNVGDYVKRLVSRSGEPVIRGAMMQAMRIMGEQFVLGRTIEEAMRRSDKSVEGVLHSFDMLGEGARTDRDAQEYFESYAAAIKSIGRHSKGLSVYDGPGISVKLSALHPRYEFAKHGSTTDLLYERVHDLALLAAKRDIGFTIDAEEADRLAFSLDLLERLARATDLKDWQGLGLALQAYQKRGALVIDWLEQLARDTNRRLMVRLVKGAYWDTEIKHAQQFGLPDYPVFTTKPASDVSYIACARKLLAAPDVFYPQFASHNAHTVSAVIELAGSDTDFEFQRLHGMGELLYQSVREIYRSDVKCRVYAPVGSHEDLLPYLVRRLLENGANSSFVHSFMDEDVPVEDVVRDPINAFDGDPHWRHPQIPKPSDIYGPSRRNSDGIDITDADTAKGLSLEVAKAFEREWQAAPTVSQVAGKGMPVANPSGSEPAGIVVSATKADCDAAFDLCVTAQPSWNNLGGDGRAKIIAACGDALEEAMPTLIGLLSREAGKTWDDGIAEVREAVDFCRYYANEARRGFSSRTSMPGPTGETNELMLEGRGVFVCISPWNFPLAIYTGQIMAALAAGNAVIAKPAEQTPLVAAEAVRIFRSVGLPQDILHLLPGDGREVGATLVSDPRVAGVAFTGSTETAQAINRSLAAKEGAIVPLIAETGGLNAMFVDSTALTEQVVDDVVRSAFGSAGQRCSALRILFLQDDIADRTIETLLGAMDEIVVGDPAQLSTDVGPIIDEEAHANLQKHLDRMSTDAKALKQIDLGDHCGDGYFFGPTLIEIPNLDVMEREVFGPILHVYRYDPAKVTDVLDELEQKGYGLTLGVHSRLRAFAQTVCQHMTAGNTYINRDIIGAVVGVQPFGGSGLSGTGPKAGGPHYVTRFANERVITDNITAQGGNAALFTLDAAAGKGSD